VKNLNPNDILMQQNKENSNENEEEDFSYEKSI
jgi:hypothetical protein